MDDDAILLAIGKLQGQMEGIGRELKAVKDMISESSEHYQRCQKEIVDRIAYLELNGAKISQKNASDIVVLDGRVTCLENSIGVTKEKEHWIDSVWAKVGLIITMTISVISFVRGFFS